MHRTQPNILVIAGSSECTCLIEKLVGLGAVTSVLTAEEALRSLKSEDFDVAFCAWELDGATWQDLLRSLKTHRVEVPVIIYYHCGGEAEWMKALEAGAFDMLAPPFDRCQLSALLEQATSSAERAKQLA